MYDDEMELSFPPILVTRPGMGMKIQVGIGCCVSNEFQVRVGLRFL